MVVITNWQVEERFDAVDHLLIVAPFDEEHEDFKEENIAIWEDKLPSEFDQNNHQVEVFFVQDSKVVWFEKTKQKLINYIGSRNPKTNRTRWPQEICDHFRWVVMTERRYDMMDKYENVFRSIVPDGFMNTTTFNDHCEILQERVIPALKRIKDSKKKFDKKY